jgi:tRNA wybutosine-synthesizing protein 3
MILKCGLQAGFRESGTVSLLDTTTKAGEVVDAATPIVAIRSMGLSFESLIGMVGPRGRRKAVVSMDYLRMLVTIGNERFVENEKRIARFLDALRSEVKKQEAGQGDGNGNGKSEKELRRERKMAEGLRRQAEARRQKEQEVVEDLAGRFEDETGSI